VFEVIGRLPPGTVVSLESEARQVQDRSSRMPGTSWREIFMEYAERDWA
jgi:hypothetical protein